MTNLRHFGKFNREEVVILGYNKTTNTVMICKITGLPADDQVELRKIAVSPESSMMDYLIPQLQRLPHANSKSSWWDYLVRNYMNKRGGLIIAYPLKEITDMNPDQLSFFKGYGRSVSDINKNSEEVAVTTDTTPVAVAAPAQAPANNDALMALLGKLVEGQNSLNESIKQLTQVATPRPRGRPSTKKTQA